MIVKEADDRSNDVAELKRLKNAAPASYHSAIQKQIDNIYSGLEGERSAAHFINREFGSSGNLAILHDLRIGVEGDYAQIDHLAIHRVQGAAWVLESKNYSGRLSCDEHGDWTVWRSGKPTSIPSPINQARRQCETLRRWLQSQQITAIRQIHPVVLISPTSSVNRKNIPSDTYVVKSDNFGEWWRRQTDALGVGTAISMVGRHFLSGLSQEDFLQMGQRLADAHVPPAFDWPAKLRLPLPKEPTVEAKAPDAPPMNSAPGNPSEGLPKIIATPHGEIKISRLSDGRYALRNDKNEALIAIVRNACKGRAQWNPRFRNWIVSEERLSEILVQISRSPAS